MDNLVVGREYIILWIYFQLLINFYFTFEMIIHFKIDNNFYATLKEINIKLELVLSTINLVLFIKLMFFQMQSQEYKLIELIGIARVLRIVTFLKETKQLKIITKTIDALVTPFYTLIMVLFMVVYMYSVIGDVLFGGLITMNSIETFKDSSIPSNYYFLNFNDALASFITLFFVEVVSCWDTISHMYVTATGTEYTRLYFLSFIIICVTMITNVIIAFVIDMYSNVEELISQQEKDHQDTEYSSAGKFLIYS
jgi:hypothetical protein